MMRRVQVGATPDRVPVPSGANVVTVYAEGGAIRVSYAETEGEAKKHYRPVPADGEVELYPGPLVGPCIGAQYIWLHTTGQTADVVLTFERRMYT